MKDELQAYDAIAQAGLVKTGEITPLELVDAAIARIETLEPKLHAIAHRDFAQARAKARAGSTGPLAGVPILLKDLLPYPGIRCAMGARVMAQYIPTEPSPYSQQLDASGLIVLGKTTSSELGLLGSTETLLEGTTHNPWAPALSATGSSGGSAAAVASGMVPFAHASDGGGSIRIPASACGLFGFKPGPNLIRSTGPIHPLFASWLIEHCVSRSVRDSDLFFAIMKSDAKDLASIDANHLTPPLQRSLRIGVQSHTTMGLAPVPEVQDALDQTVALLQQLGHRVDALPVNRSHGSDVSDAYFTLAGAAHQDTAQMLSQMLGRAPGEADLEPFTLDLIEWYRSLPNTAVSDAMAKAEVIKSQTLATLQEVDVVLSPTLPILPPPLGFLAPTLERRLLIERTEQIAGYTAIYTMAHAPAMSVPLCQSTEGLPIGMHFAAIPGSETTLLGLAYQLEEAQPWAQRWPGISGQ